MVASVRVPESMCSRPSVPCGCRLRSVGDPGLKIRSPGAGLVQRDMGVPEHHEVRCGELAAHPHQAPGGGAAVVHHRHAEPVQVEFGGLGGAPGRHIRLVVVPEHGGHRSVLGEFGEDRGGADVARVQDQVRVAQVLGHPGRAGPPPARRMSVSQDHDPHGTSP